MARICTAALAAVLVVVVGLASCSAETAAPPERMSTPAPTGPPLTFVALGDSWPNGAHCGGCRTFMGLYADRLTTAGHRVTFVDRTEAVVPGTDKGQTPASLLQSLRTQPDLRREVAAADVVVLHTGANDLEQSGVVGAHQSDQCGGNDNLACFRRLGAQQRQTFEGILRQLTSLRRGRPTAIRLVTAENHFLSDRALQYSLGKDFARTAGRLFIDQLAQAMCAAATKAAARCVDLRPLLNGPSMDQPSKGENAPETHQAVADALFATGLPELS